MSWSEYGLSRWEVMAILAAYVAKREKLDQSQYRGQVEFTVFRDRTIGVLTLDYVKVRFEKKPEPQPEPKTPTEPPAAPTFM